MHEEVADVSVVIPTLGRPDVWKAVSSVLSQTVQPREVIVVDASDTGIDSPKEFSLDRVRVLRPEGSKARETGLRWTAAANRNFGVRASCSSFVAFLDDDDAWLPTKLELQMAVLRRRPDALVSCQSIYRLPSGKEKLRPKQVVHAGEDVFALLYGARSFRRLSHYFPTPSLLISRETALKIPMPEDVPGFEDTLWIHLLQKDGHALVQVPTPLVVVHADPFRSISRDSVPKNVAWAETLAKVDSRYATNFLLGVCQRNAMVMGRVWDVFQLARASRVFGAPLYQLSSVPFVAVGSVIAFLLRSVLSRGRRV
jgi:hypothetical protein